MAGAAASPALRAVAAAAAKPGQRARVFAWLGSAWSLSDAAGLVLRERVLGVEVPFFFQGSAEGASGKGEGAASPINDFLSDREGIELAKAFTAITDPGVRRAIVELARATAVSCSSSGPGDDSDPTARARRKAPARSS
jgi:hypothetical protein